MISENGDFILLNYLILGAKGVGKTSIINQYRFKSWRNNDYIFRRKYKMFDGVNFKIQFWEQNSISKSMQELFNPYKLVDAIIIIIDVQNENSISQIYNFYGKLGLIRFKDMKPIIIVANKCDSLQRQDIFIFPREIQNKLGLQYFEVTAKDYFTINTMFETIFLQCVGLYISQSKIKQSNLSQYYQDQNNGLQLCILEY